MTLAEREYFRTIGRLPRRLDANNITLVETRLMSNWPTVLIPLKLLAKPGDRGAGDIIARVIGPVGGDAFKAWYKKLFGTDCGCGGKGNPAGRQESLNERWPL